MKLNNNNKNINAKDLTREEFWQNRCAQKQFKKKKAKTHKIEKK